MIKYNINDSINKHIHPITGFKICSRFENYRNNEKKKVSNKDYKEREKNRLRKRYLNTIEQSIK